MSESTKGNKAIFIQASACLEHSGSPVNIWGTCWSCSTKLHGAHNENCNTVALLHRFVDQPPAELDIHS